MERAIRAPLWTEQEPRYDNARRCFAAIDEFDGRILRVVCVETHDAIRVIIATFEDGPFIYDVDSSGRILGIEILGASKVLAPGDWTRARLPGTPAADAAE